ncbi:MAG: AsmA family protein, partial [Alphaproteobacteria bacterium]|nr:AsmA family protein [Alphaproteobacteria bacterium]
LDGRYDTGAEPAALSGSLALTGAPLATVLAETVGTTAVDGTLDLRVDAAATGRSPAALIAGLSGDGLAAVRDGAIDGLDLAELGRRLDGLDDPLGFVEVLDATVGRGRTPFDALNLPFAIDAGTVTTDRLRLAAPAAEGAGSGSLDLGRGRLDLVVDLTLARLADAPAFGLRLTGEPGDPRLRLETEALQAFLARRAAEALAE